VGLTIYLGIITQKSFYFITVPSEKKITEWTCNAKMFIKAQFSLAIPQTEHNISNCNKRTTYVLYVAIRTSYVDDFQNFFLLFLA
jgi:hypothetical protein